MVGWLVVVGTFLSCLSCGAHELSVKCLLLAILTRREVHIHVLQCRWRSYLAVIATCWWHEVDLACTMLYPLVNRLRWHLSVVPHRVHSVVSLGPDDRCFFLKTHQL